MATESRRLPLKRLAVASLVVFILIVLLIVLCNIRVVTGTADRIHASLEEIPDNDVGLILGASPYTREGYKSMHFAKRIESGARLYHAGKVHHLILSGANPDQTYNEPRKMYQALAALGVPGEAMTMDFAGFRTLDSVVRAKEVFNIQDITIISQRYHDYRAIYIADHIGLDAVAFAAPPYSNNSWHSRSVIREYFARVRAVLDLHVFRTQPRFKGDPIRIHVSKRDK